MPYVVEVQDAPLLYITLVCGVQAAVEQKQVLLRQAHKLTTDAEAKCKMLEQQLATVQARCL